MFRRKSKQGASTRQVRSQSKAKMFSYGVGRFSDKSVNTQNLYRQSFSKKKSANNQNISGNRKSRTVVFSLGIVIICLMVYVTTLDGSAEFKLVETKAINKLTVPASEYQSGINKILSESLVNRSKILINTTALERRIESKYPTLNNVNIIIPLIGKRLVVRAEQAQARAVIISHDNGYILDDNGRVISEAKELTTLKLTTLPVILDESGLLVSLGKYALTKETVQFITEVVTQLDDKNYNIQSIVLPPVSNELRIKLKDTKYYIKFDLKGESRVQAGTFIATQKKLSNDNIVPKEYIDVRVPGKAYYK